jgi:transposase, IS30 family
VVGALTKHVRKLPQQLRRSLTWDRGKEMADHKSFTVTKELNERFVKGAEQLANAAAKSARGQSKAA